MKILAEVQGAGHAVLRTLYSRAQRIGMNGISFLLRSLFQSVSLNRLVIVIGNLCVCISPAFELAIFPEQELECFGDNVRRVGIKKLCVPVQIASDFLLQTNLKICSLWLL